jgi:hypothetical protein
MEQTQLLCTFTSAGELQTVLKNIRETYKIVYNYIYVLENRNTAGELYITYNIDVAFKPETQLVNTILVHRKKQSNTIYTINALNQLIKEENGGVLDKKFAVDWEKFKNCIILTGNEGIRKIPTKIFEKIEFS